MARHSASLARGARVWALIAVSYATVLEAIHLLWAGRATFSMESGIKTLVIPMVQALVVALLRDDTNTGVATTRDRYVERFLARWLILITTLWLTNAIVELLIARRIELTEGALLLLLTIPTAQAAALTLPSQSPRRLLQRLRTIARHGFAGPMIALDVAIVSAAWFFHDQINPGFAGSVAIQRQWMGTKMIAAAALLAWFATGFRPRVEWARDRLFLLIAAVVLCALGIDGVRPWIQTLATAPLEWTAPSRLLVRAVVYGIALAVGLVVTVRLRDWAAHRCRSEVAPVFGAAVVFIFLAALPLVLNGFVSAVPVYPWASSAVVLGSLAASALLVGSILATTSPPGRQ